MRTTALWAFWRRVQYGTGFLLFWILVFTGGYFAYFYESATCFDGSQNGNELGIDCGGGCLRICAFQVSEPKILWAKSFKVIDGQYNAVAYIENINKVAATPEVRYTFSLYDANGLIIERSGTTILPPDSVYPVFEGRIITGGRIPIQTIITLEEPEMWLPARSGREQFTVIDRKLVNADTLPRLESTLANNALTEAKEVEVVATIFDARGNALTSSQTFINNFAPQSRVDVVFTWPEPITKTLRSCSVPMDVVVAIDLSGSMNNDAENPPEPITSVIKAADAFVNRLRSEDSVSIVTFATEAITNLSLTNDSTEASSIVNSLRIKPEEETGSTNTGDAFLKAKEELGSMRHNKDARKVMVLLTDGLATAPDKEPEAYAVARAEELKATETEVFVIGLGTQVNMEFVRSVSSGPSYTYQALDSKQVDRMYRSITGAICEDGVAVIDVIPKTDASFETLR